MFLSIRNTLWILSMPSLPNSAPHALRLGGTLGDRPADFSEVPSSTSSRLGRLQQSNLISCSAALQMTPGSWTKTRNGDALMAIIAVWLEQAKVQLGVQSGHTLRPLDQFQDRQIKMMEYVYARNSRKWVPEPIVQNCFMPFLWSHYYGALWILEIWASQFSIKQFICS